MYVVYLIGNAENQNIAIAHYKPGYFPRKFRYKWEALNLQAELHRAKVFCAVKSEREYNEMIAELQNIDENIG